MSDQFEHLERIGPIAGGGSPTFRIRLLDAAGAAVDLSQGYDQFSAVVARRNAPTTAVLTITTGVAGGVNGFVVPAAQISALDPRFDYVITAQARNIATGEPRRAQALVEISPAPAVP